MLKFFREKTLPFTVTLVQFHTDMSQSERNCDQKSDPQRYSGWTECDVPTDYFPEQVNVNKAVCTRLDGYVCYSNDAGDNACYQQYQCVKACKYSPTIYNYHQQFTFTGYFSKPPNTQDAMIVKECSTCSADKGCDTTLMQCGSNGCMDGQTVLSKEWVT